MCKYCEQKKWTREEKKYDYDFNHRVPLDYDDGYVGLYIGINKCEEYYLAAVGDDEVRQTINYCPMCGRKLREE